jgi:hypothetical protein
VHDGRGCEEHNRVEVGRVRKHGDVRLEVRGRALGPLLEALRPVPNARAQAQDVGHGPAEPLAQPLHARLCEGGGRAMQVLS